MKHPFLSDGSMWHFLSARSSSASAFRWLCAMTVSSGVMSFWNHESNRQYYGPSPKTRSLTNSDLIGNAALLAVDKHHLAKCEEQATTTSSMRRNEVESSYQRMPLPARGESDGHAIFGLLLGENMIESYDIYQRPKEEDQPPDNKDNVIVAYIKLGDKIDGHPGVVHGGIVSLIFDDALGFGYEAIGVEMAVTANLNVDFRAPVLAGTEIRVVAQLERQEGRKLFWKAQMTSTDETILYAEATSLYIIPRSSP